MREKVNRLRHLGVLFLTIIIFFLGVFISSSIEDLRVESLVNQLQEQDLEYQKIVTESNYIEYLLNQKNSKDSSISCQNLEDSFFTSIENLDDARERLEGYIGTANSNEEEFARLQEYYDNVQINYLMLSQRISQLCEENNVIIYFYANDEDCPECEDQGVHLDYVKQKLRNDVMIFSFDVQKDGPIDIVESQYNVSNYQQMPVLIVNDKKLDFSNSDIVFDTLCEQGLNNSDVCGEN